MSSRTRIVLGIGNPEEKYRETRHNVGWMVVDKLSQKMDAKFRKAGFEFWAAEGRLAGDRVVLVKTWTYVNRTGQVIPELRKRWGDDLLAVCDDVALPVGSVRIRAKGSSGGHNGLQSVLDAWGGDTVPRLRIGVGGGRPDPDYVLGRFPKAQMEVVEETVAYAAEAIECWVSEGLERTMTKYNRVRKENDETV